MSALPADAVVDDDRPSHIAGTVLLSAIASDLGAIGPGGLVLPRPCSG